MGNDKQLTRAEFCRMLGRGLGVAGLGLLAARLGRRALTAESCDRAGWCRDCGRQRACGLPQAQSYRRHLEEGDNG